MIQYYLSCLNKPYTALYFILTISVILQLQGLPLQAQTCPPNGSISINTFPNTYFPGVTASLNAGSSSIDVGPAGYGATPIAPGDLLLLIQMQGAQIGFANDSTYGKNFSGDGRVNGYINNGQLLAGNMEYVIATNAVGTGGGTVNLLSPTVNNYQAATYTGSYGQYTYQLIGVASYFNVSLGSTIQVPSWNGSTGGVLVMYAVNELNMNGNSISARGAGFRGGGGIMLNGLVGGAANSFRTATSLTYSAAKGEGIAGTPRYINDNGVLIDYGASLEGYPSGSMGMSAPGNAGGGGTQSNKHTANTNNAGGGGGSNGSIGGKGGNSWSSNLPVGGEPGAVFAQASVTRLVMGGGGGAGCNDDATGTPASGLASSGAAGGGIVIVYAHTITGTGAIDVSGADGYTTVENDATGGGGAGGSVIIDATSGLSGVTVRANGGNGGSNTGRKIITGVYSPHGPGGGGGGGVIFASGTLNASSSTSGGANGTTSGSAPYGSESGTPSSLLMQNVVINSPMSCTVLPLEFLSLFATANADRIQVDWKVTNETGKEKYIIERSNNGINFTSLDTLFYHSHTGAVNAYRFSDVITFGNTTCFYRVRTIDAQARAVLSRIVAVKPATTTGSVYLSPNPAHKQASLHLVSTVHGTAELVLLDMAGRACWRQQYVISRGINVLPIEGLDAMRNGMYLLYYNDGSGPRNTRLLIQH